MDLREHMEYLVRAGDVDCSDGYRCDECPFNSQPCWDHTFRGAFAKKWLGDHPEKPKAGPSPIYKGADRGESTYSLSLNNDRISLYRFHGQDSESIGFGGTVDDFNQFDEARPEEWFDVAAKMIAGRK